MAESDRIADLHTEIAAEIYGIPARLDDDQISVIRSVVALVASRIADDIEAKTRLAIYDREDLGWNAGLLRASAVARSYSGTTER